MSPPAIAWSNSNAHTGRPIESFGDHGMVDLKVGAYTGVIGSPASTSRSI